MPGHEYMTDQQIADVLTYVRNSFGNKAKAVTVAEVKAVRAKTK
jgi:mono/diheme cytochrome c family protein